MVTAGRGGGQTGAMGTLQRLVEPLAAYPRWLVVTCLLLAAVAAGWLLVKLAKWALGLLLAVAVLAAVVLAVIWLLG